MKTRKLRLVSALLAVAMMLALLPTAAFAADGELPTSGTCGKDGSDVKWELDTTTGTLTISGTGAMKDYNIFNPNQPWLSQRDSIKHLVVENGVTSIGKNAFANCLSLETVELPQNGVLETIKHNAFSWSYSSPEVGAGITEITIPKSVKTIEGYAFDGCTKLATVIFAKGSQLDEVERDVFRNCSNVTIYYSDETVKTALISGKVDADRIKPLTPTVTFISNGGSNVEPATVKNGEAISAPDAPTREGWNFAGWYTKKDGNWAEKPFNFDTLITDNMTLYARWETKLVDITPATELYPITIDYGTAYDAEGKPIEKAAAGDVVTIKADETALEGMTFERWEVRKGEVKLENDRAAKTSFTMPAGEVQLEAMAPATRLYPITIDYGTAYDAEGNPITKAAAGDVVTIKADETALEGMTFERWEVRKGEVKLENDRAAETTFTMPAGEVQLEAMYQAADVHDSGWDAATVVTGAVIGTGTAILAYHIGMEVYAEQVLGKDVAVPRTRGEVALLAWQLAGSPEPNAAVALLTDEAKAQQWAVESGLLQLDAEGNFHAEKKLSKWKALRVLDKAKKQV